jgi:hypothetical protein
MGETSRATAARRRSYTPELLADGRRRFEQTDEPITAIAADFGCCKATFMKLAKDEGWVRPPRARDLTPSARLRLRAEALASEQESAQAAALSPPPDPPSLPLRRFDLPPPGGGEERDAGGGDAGEPPLADTVDALHAAARRQLDEFNAEQTMLKGTPQAVAERERAARTLANLTATLQRLQAMRSGAPQPETDYDDIPADIDAFRNELARRIRAFVASRSARGDADGDGGPPVAAARS